MRIEIYVVKTELDRTYVSKTQRWKETEVTNNLARLEVIKSEIVHIFGGMTIIPNCKGYWEESTKFYIDNVEIWLIYTSTSDGIEMIKAFAKRIKILTFQKNQAFAINGKFYLV